MPFAFSRFRSDAEDDLEVQLARLSKDVNSLRKAISRRGASAYGDARDAASDFYGEMRHHVADALPVISRRAKDAERVARENPALTAAVGLAVVGLIITLVARR